jgi:tetratricopeptide (TPR) repeat protein
MAGVFVSYRRSDGGGWAGRLKDHLALRFGATLVWQDVDDLEIGKDYLPQILKGIKSSDAVLFIIGPHWLKDGGKRLKDAKDVLRMEITHALKKKAGVIPTLVGGAKMPAAKHLPSAVAGLVKRDGIALSDVDWARSMQFLFEKLQDVVRGGGKTEPLPDLHGKLEETQARYFGLMEANPAQAAGVAEEALHLLDEQMPSYPHDHYLQMFRGFFLKNRAMSLRDLGDQKGSESALRDADRTFQTIREEAELYLGNAYTGLGSVMLLKGQGKDALRYIDKPLELVPNHPFARHDREEALRYLGSEGRQSS